MADSVCVQNLKKKKNTNTNPNPHFQCFSPNNLQENNTCDVYVWQYNALFMACNLTGHYNKSNPKSLKVTKNKK